MRSRARAARGGRPMLAAGPEGAARSMMTLAEIRAFLDEHFPQLQKGGRYTVEELRPHASRMRAAFHERQIRPGGTISGPTMMALADVALCVTIMAAIGPVALAVTTNLNINFLRKP